MRTADCGARDARDDTRPVAAIALFGGGDVGAHFLGRMLRRSELRIGDVVDPDKSIFVYRLEVQDPAIMIFSEGRRLVRETSVILVREWI